MLMFLLVLFSASLVQGNKEISSDEIPSVVLNFINQAEEVKTIEYSCLVCREHEGEKVPSWMPRKEKLFVDFDIFVIHDLVKFDLLQKRTYNATDQLGELTSELSQFDGIQESFAHDDSKGSTLGLPVGNGYVGPVGDTYRKSCMFYGPELAIGATFRQRMREGLDSLADESKKRGRCTLMENQNVPLLVPFGDMGTEIVNDLPAFKQHINKMCETCLLYTSPSPRDATLSRMPSSA